MKVSANEYWHHNIVLSLFLFITTLPSISFAGPEIDSAKIKKLIINSVQAPVSKVALNGPDSRRQIIVRGELANGSLIDLTRNVKYSIHPEDSASVSKDGYLTPLRDGKSKLNISLNELSADLEFEVTGIEKPNAINFKNQVVPIFTKLNCNGGGCHGKSSGQNGFKLSLLGFYPDDDYEFLVKEGRGRRLFPMSPDSSLLLQKGTGQVPHGGGSLIEVDSPEYRILYRWIEQGMPLGESKSREVVSIDCFPSTQTMKQNQSQQISVTAHFSDGTSEDVTRMAVFEPNDLEMAEVKRNGLVSTLSLSGEVAVMARYQGHVSTFRATIPMGAPVESLPETKNFIDEAIFNKLKVLGIPPSSKATDETFVRRITIDLTGTTPTAAEVTAFLANTDPQKRDKLIDQLVDSLEYADYFANKWNMILRNKKTKDEDLAATNAFREWIWTSIYENKPYDKFVGEILSASGGYRSNPAVVWYREVDTIDEQVEDAAQLFLGVRIQCARCHHHPFEKWSMDDYYGLAAFFSRVNMKDVSVGGYVKGKKTRDRRVYHRVGLATARNSRTGVKLKPTTLGMKPLEISVWDDPRLELVDWLSRKDNPYFAKSLVNRYWKHFFARAIVEPEDDMRETNPPSNPELLNGLAKHFVENNFDLKDLVRTIVKSNAYQLSAQPNDYNLKDKQNYSRYYPKRLSAEVLYDVFHQVTAAEQKHSKMPVGTRAIQLTDMSNAPYFLKVFGQPQGDSACECERSQNASLAQSLHLLNSMEIQKKITGKDYRAAKLANDSSRTHEAKIRELYSWVYSRQPKENELKFALLQIEKQKEKPQIAYEDIVWALINTKEFLFNH